LKVEKVTNHSYQVWVNDKKAIVIKATNKKEAEKKLKKRMI